MFYFQSNNILLTEPSPVRGGVGCLEGGPRPRPILAEGKYYPSYLSLLYPVLNKQNAMYT